MIINVTAMEEIHFRLRTGDGGHGLLLRAEGDGLTVDGVEPGTAADATGIRTGASIVEVNGVGNLCDLSPTQVSAAWMAEGGAVRLRVRPPRSAAVLTVDRARGGLGLRLGASPPLSPSRLCAPTAAPQCATSAAAAGAWRRCARRFSTRGRWRWATPSSPLMGWRLRPSHTASSPRCWAPACGRPGPPPVPSPPAHWPRRPQAEAVLAISPGTDEAPAPCASLEGLLFGIDLVAAARGERQQRWRAAAPRPALQPPAAEATVRELADAADALAERVAHRSAELVQLLEDRDTLLERTAAIKAHAGALVAARAGAATSVEARMLRRGTATTEMMSGQALCHSIPPCHTAARCAWSFRLEPAGGVIHRL